MHRPAAAVCAAILVLAGGAGILLGRGGGDAPAERPDATAPRTLRGLMTPAAVRQVIGPPDRVFRRNRRSLCWTYVRRSVRLCFGPRRRLAWWSSSSPVSCGARLTFDAYDGRIQRIYRVRCYQEAVQMLGPLTPRKRPVYDLLMRAVRALRKQRGTLRPDLPVPPTLVRTTSTAAHV